MTANHLDCHTCHQPVRRGDAVIRSDGHTQYGFHPACYTIHRAIKDVVASEVEAEMVGGTLTERLARVGRW